MVFKVIDNQIVGLTKSIKTFSVASSGKVTRLIDAFNNLKMTTGLTTKTWDTMIDGVERKYGQNAADYLRSVAKQGDAARASVDKFYAALVQDIPTHGFRNVQAVINQYNSLDPTTQKQFAQAIGLTNKNLGNYLTNLDGGQAKMSGYAGQLVVTTTKTIGLKAATMALNAAIGLVISWAISGIMKLVNAQKEALEKAKEVADANNEEISSLKDLKKQYLDIIDSSKSMSEKDAELAEWKNTLATKYDIEIDKLKELNYERKIALDLIDEEILKQAKQTFANEEFKRKYDEFLKEYYNADYGNTSAVTHATQRAHIETKIDNNNFKAISDYLKREFGISTNASSGIDTTLGFFGSTYSLEIEVNTDEKSLEEAMNVYADALNTINNKKEYFEKEIGQESNKQNKDKLEDELSLWQYYGDAVQDAYNRLEKIKSDYETYKSGIAQDALLRFDDFIKQSGNSIDIIINEQDAIKWVNKLIEEKSDNIDVLAEELKKIAADELPDFRDAILNVSKDTDKSTLSVKKLTDAYEKLSDVLDDVFKKQDKLADLYEKIAKGTELTASEAYELIDQFPELTEHLVRVGSKWSFDIKGVNEAFDVLDDEFAQKAQEVIDNNKKVLEQSFEDYYTENTKLSFDDFLKEKGIDSISINSASDYENFKKLQEEFNENVLADRNELLKSYTERQDAANAEVERAIALQQLLNNQINDFDFDVDNYNDKIKELMDASEKMAEGEALSYDELTSLIDQFPELKYSGENGEYFIEKAALDELIEKSYEERNARIDDEIAKTYAVNEEVANRVKAYEDEKERLENAIDENRRKYDESYNNPDLTDGILERIALETEHTKLINELKALDDEQYAADKALMESQDEYNEAYRKYLEALKGKLTSGDRENSLSNQLQDQIGYYETLLSAIEAVTDKQIEALEDEKDALEKQKDTLKDANDERQRELDLIEARNNLENAKKRKVYVYTEGSGFQQAQDKKAVKEADEKLRDVELEIQEANIDKQIDKLDEQIDAFEDYKKQFSDMKSDIEDLITIEKAKNALDLDEQGLLNLPPETAKEIQEGLANAVLKKDKEDNKDNKEYERFGDVVIDRLLKKWGSPLTAEEAFKKWDAISYNSGFPTDFLNPSNGNVVDNSEVYNNSNKNITFAPNITVYGGSSEQEIADIAVKEMEKVFRATYNSIK